jgi:hypothetical protein
VLGYSSREIGEKLYISPKTVAQVLNVWGQVIAGLYAVGNTSGSPIAGGYPGGGGTLSAGLTFAHIAAMHLIQQPPRD